MEDKKPKFTGRWGFLFEALVLAAVSVGLAMLANAAHPDGLSWSPQPEVAQETDTGGVSVSEAMELVRSGRGLFLDARHPEDFADGHIPGALSVPPGLFAEEVEALLADVGQDKVLVAYCSNLQCPLSHRLADALDMIGIEGVRVFEGGMQEWEQAGGSVEAGFAQGTAHGASDAGGAGS